MPAGLNDYGWVWIVAFAAIIGFALYLRGRRLIGRQRYSERRILVRMAILAVAVFLILYSYTRRGSPVEAYASVGAGFAIGVVIAFLALRFTRMGRDERGIWYVPNLYLGIGLIALLIARFVYEYVVVFPKVRHAAAGGTVPVATGFGAPTILNGILFLVLGYFLVYYLGIYLRARRVRSKPPEKERETQGKL